MTRSICHMASMNRCFPHHGDHSGIIFEVCKTSEVEVNSTDQGKLNDLNESTTSNDTTSQQGSSDLVNPNSTIFYPFIPSFSRLLAANSLIQFLTRHVLGPGMQAHAHQRPPCLDLEGPGCTRIWIQNMRGDLTIRRPILERLAYKKYWF